MAAKKRSKRTQVAWPGVDPDAQNARILAQELAQLADALEAEDADRYESWRPVIKELVKVYWDLHDPRPNVADRKHRDFVVALLKAVGKESTTGTVSADLFLAVVKRNLPEYTKRLSDQREIVEAILRSYQTKAGGRGRRVGVGEGRPALIETLCSKLGWTAGAGAIRQARARRRKLVTP